MTAPSPRSASDASGAGIAANVDGGWVELHEFRIGDERAGPCCHREALAARVRRVGGDFVEVSDAAGSEHDGASRHEQPVGEAAPPVADDQTRDERPLGAQLLGKYGLPECGSRRAAHGDASAAMTAAPAMSPRGRTMRCREWAASRESLQRAVLVPIEQHSVADEVVDAGRRFARHPERHPLVDEAGAGRERVGDVLLDAVARTDCGSDPALRQCRRSSADRRGGDDRDRARRELERAEEAGQPAADDHDVVDAVPRARRKERIHVPQLSPPASHAGRLVYRLAGGSGVRRALRGDCERACRDGRAPRLR